ncbi:MAG: EAL domain-containing protein [Sodalis sp. (in: enterobacteria)]|uniref:EAL domain-containing protein n=1 Tax=Sodalis sp. (in: enterobacteria) TaxID=1898979 RepID=UPI0039E5EC7C
MPADVIKIDRSLISNMTVDARNRVILTYLIKMLHDLHYPVIAEGVTERTRRRLTKWPRWGLMAHRDFISHARCPWRRSISLWRRWGSRSGPCLTRRPRSERPGVSPASASATGR